MTEFKIFMLTDIHQNIHHVKFDNAKKNKLFSQFCTFTQVMIDLSKGQAR